MTTPGRVGFVGLVVMGLLAGGCSVQQNEWQQDVYAWQRVWSESMQHSVDDLTPEVNRLRILVAQYGGGQAPVVVDLDEALPALARRSVVATVRIDGTRLEIAPDALWAWIAEQLTRLQDSGVNPLALEIDHDTATAAVGDYAAWLIQLRDYLPNGLELWVTALPDWRHAEEIGRLLNVTDRYTLQVHGVAGDGDWLMNGERALAWANEFARMSTTPFYVAVPTYQLRAGLGRDGGLRFLEAEAAVPARASDERALFMPPQRLATWLADLKAANLPGLLGVAWFRLPVAEDRANISLATLNALVERRELVADVELLAEPVRKGSTTFDLSLINHGPHDAAWPAEVSLPADCTRGEGANGFQIRRQPAPCLLHSQPGLLKAGEAVSGGWVRCSRSASEAFELMAITRPGVR